jgi:hypothetical protein
MIHNITNQTFNINIIDIYIHKIQLYSIYLILICGITGNIISLFIFTRPNLNKKTNTGILYTFLCVLNLLILFENLFFSSNSMIIFGINSLMTNPQYQCKLEIFVRNSLNELLSWLQVLICFDRLILVIYPTKAHKMRKKVYWLLYIYIFFYKIEQF